MSDPAPKAELLQSLGKLARGLSALFWGLPAALILSVETARPSWLKSFGVVPVLAANGLLLFGLWQMSDFQKQERPWRNDLDRAKLLGLINLGLCPFLLWHNRIPQEAFFNGAVFVLVLSAIVFLFNLNRVIKRLGAMLPDETLRHETIVFSALNSWLLVFLLVLYIAYEALSFISNMSPVPGVVFGSGSLEFSIPFNWFEQAGLWLLTFFALLPVAMTMALIWKTKETILDSVFGAK